MPFKKRQGKSNGTGNKKLPAKLKVGTKYHLPDEPFVSICTPTFNRRPFIPYTIKCIESQDYPKDKVEWIIIDDGSDPIEDLVAHLPYVKYFKYDKKMSLGKKRNLMHEKSKGDVLVYFDDDDYYPPDRVSHSVESLKKNKRALCAGSSKIYIYFDELDKLYSFGPYGPNHATAGTFAFKRDLLKYTRYDDDRAIAEEKAFLKQYTIPFQQLDPEKTIVVFSHNHNTFDKRELLKNPDPQIVKEVTDLTIKDLVKGDELQKFFIGGINDVIKDYDAGKIENKPDVVEQTKKIRAEREKRIEEMIEQKKQEMRVKPIQIRENGKVREIDNLEAAELMKRQMDRIHELESLLKMAYAKLEEAGKEIETLKGKQQVDSSTNTTEE